ncbi:MAG TPA: hypothetical protein V6D18_05910 [Thermosynechococcaceae cyanobacterium]
MILPFAWGDAVKSAEGGAGRSPLAAIRGATIKLAEHSLLARCDILG